MSRQSGMAQKPNQNRIPSGFDGELIPTDFFIPSCGIEDVDVALFNLFDKDNFIQISINDEEGNFDYKHKVPVVFATGERFALRQRNKPFRDKTGSLILPIICIDRVGINQEKGYLGGMGLGQNTGDFVIRKKLSERDREYQNIINRLGLSNQDNVASVSNFLNSLTEVGNSPGTFATRREKFNKKTDQMLRNDLNQNIYEIITMPFPVFYHLTYEVEIWTSYIQQMNEITEKIMTNYDGQGRTYVINTTKGYWFVAIFEDEISYENNIEEFTEEARMFRTKFRINVPAYMIANQNGGDMVPFRRYLSAPQISFETYDGIFDQPFVPFVPESDPDKFILNDVEDLDRAGNEKGNREEKFYQRKIIRDPFSGEDEDVFVEVKYRNARNGEIVLSKRKLFNIDVP